MKKLLVLMLVLGLASLANAGLVVSFDASEISVGIEETVTGYEITVEVISGDLALDGSAVTYDYTWDFDNLVSTDTPDLFRVSASQFLSAAQGPGTLFSGLAYTGAGTAVFTDLYNQSAPVSVLIPEPMTMVLLGLGGLFLRRRK